MGPMHDRKVSRLCRDGVATRIAGQRYAAALQSGFVAACVWNLQQDWATYVCATHAQTLTSCTHVVCPPGRIKVPLW